jgi:hypothetical protein
MVYSNNFGQSRVGVRNRVVNVVNSVDADAIAFIAAAGITNLTQASAINTLVNDLKTYGLWTKMKALYPMVGGTATSHKFNLKDPRDLDAAYRLVFNGGWTHTSTGALPNGTTGYADTKFIIAQVYPSNITNIHVSYYSRTNTNNYNMIGMQDDSVGNGSQVYIQDNGAVQYYSALNTDANSITVNKVQSSIGYYLTSRTSLTSLKGYRDGVIQGSNTITSSSSNLRSTLPFVIGATIYKLSSTQYYYGNKESAFASIGDGLTDTEAANFYNSVQKFQTSLGRQIGSPIVSDTDAQAFINAAGLTDLGQANAVNTLVVDLKSAGVWTKMKALYPFVGGNATSHKFNLKDPRDLDAAFRLQFNGGWTHTSTGAKPNGTTGYADTKFIPSTNLGAYSVHLSYYSRTNRAIRNSIVMGAWQDAPTDNNVDIRFYAGTSTIGSSGSGMFDGAFGTDYASYVTGNSNYFLIGNKTAINLNKVYENGVLKATSTITSTRSLPNVRVLIGAEGRGVSGATNYDILESAFASIGDGLTDSEASSFYTAVQKYQTTLGRQIGTPVLAEGQTAGLLETYSGAAAAYSLRKLRTGYVGNAIRVRRSSDNAEQDIAFDASGNLDTVSLLAFVGSGNGFVTTWYDQSGNGQHAVQTIASNQPYIVNAGVVNTYNSKPCVKFDGVDDFIQSPYATGTSNELYFVTQTTDTGFLFPRGYHGQGFIAEQGSTNTETSSYWTTQPQLYVNSTLRSPANRNDVYNLLNGYKLSLHKGANISNNWFYLRFGSFIQNGYLDFNGNLFEWVIYPTLQSSQSSIESNINTYYSIY